MYCHWNVVKKLGGKETEPILVTAKEAKIPTTTGKSVTASFDICEELAHAQHDTQHSDRFEAAVSAAFTSWGLNAS